LRENSVEPFHRSEGDYLGSSEAGAGSQSLDTIGNYIDICQCKCADHLTEEGGLLVIRFDQGQVDLGSPELQGNSGESGTGPNVEDVGRIDGSRLGYVGNRRRGHLCQAGWEKMTRHKQRLAEVAGYDFFFLADGGQVDASVPVLQ
jgi:hypothetical protein